MYGYAGKILIIDLSSESAVELSTQDYADRLYSSGCSGEGKKHTVIFPMRSPAALSGRQQSNNEQGMTNEA